MRSSQVPRLPVGTNVVTGKTIDATSKTQFAGAHLFHLTIPEGVEGNVIADGVNSKQKIVRFVLRDSNDKLVHVDCPLALDTINYKG